MDPGESDAETPEVRLAVYSRDLRLAIAASIEPWLVSVLRDRLEPLGWNEAHASAVLNAARECRREVESGLVELFGRDIDEQSDTPLAILARACVPANTVLADAGVAAPRRDPTEEAMNPRDVYGLAPTTWADLGPDVVDAAISWGAAKAYVHLRRRR